MTSRSSTLVEAISHDHREIEAYYNAFVKNEGNLDAQERWVHQFTWEVARHSIGEEIAVYPLLEKHLGQKGKEMADQDREDHQYVKERLAKVEDLKADSRECTTLMKDIMDHLKQHMQNEENEDFPLLEKELGKTGSQKAAASFERVKKIVPTRSHPGAPNKPPFETLAGLITAPIDKLKDMFSTFPSEEERQAVMQN